MERHRRPQGSLIAGIVLALSTFGCNGSNSSDDGGNEDPTTTCTVAGSLDKSTNMATATDLAEGKEVTGYICPTKDQDYFKITIPTGSKLLRVKLSASVADTAVQLTYRIVKAGGSSGSDETSVATAPTFSGSGLRTYDAYHCIDPGTYYLVVQDDGNNNRDPNNPYTLSYTTTADLDKNESNDTIATATTITSGGTVTGYLSCASDLDYYKVTVAADQLVQVALSTTTAPTAALRYTIYDSSKTAIATDQGATTAAVSLKTIHAVPKAGTYYLIVDDAGSGSGDPKSPYSLIVTMLAEQDSNDKGTRNDTAAGATSLGSYSSSDGTKTFTATGQIGSKADVDIYKISGFSGVTADNPAVIEVSVSYGKGSKVDPAVSLIYPHTSTTCTSDACCNVVATSCTGNFSCLRETATCVQKGDTYCSNTACVASPSSTCATDKACAGASLCLSEKYCGAEQFTKFCSDGTTTASVKTAQPLLHPGPWYIRVYDYKSDDYDYGSNYTLTVKVRMDPDGTKELNSEYFGPEFAQTGTGTYLYHLAAAKKKGDTITLGTALTGYISYENDQDWYAFAHPCTGADCTLQFSWTLGSNCPSDLKFVFELRTSDGGEFFNFPKNGSSSSSGYGASTGECVFADKGDSGYYVVVRDYNYKAYSWTCSYTLTVSKVADGCVSPCKYYTGTTNCTAQ
jgi:hypothetical protein